VDRCLEEGGWKPGDVCRRAVARIPWPRQRVNSHPWQQKTSNCQCRRGNGGL
jgi:hypothetical protein